MRWRQQAAARQSSYLDYHLIRLQAVSYPHAEQAADWEFSYDRNGIIVHILSRNVLVNARHAYALCTGQLRKATGTRIITTLQPSRPPSGRPV